MAWKVRQVVGNEYTIERELGDGGFGITYLAFKKNGQKVVIKTLNDKVQQRPDFAKLQQDFLNEALRLAKCSHPHIAKVGPIFQEGHLWCMVMDYIDGGNLAERVIQKGVFPEDEALLYIQQIGAALTVVHQQGLLHRDIKPQNIMLRQGTKEAVLIDFGIAREFTPNLTQTHTQFLTDGYAPIEQYYKRNKRGAYTDIYALAATLYSLLTGVVPVAALDRERGAPLEPPKRLNPKISDQTNQAILKGMALKPHNRPQLMDDWLKMLRIATVPVSPKLKPAPIFLFGMGILMALAIAVIIRPPNISVVISTQPSYPVSVDSLMVIPPQFDHADNFSEGLAAVKINDKWGSIDKTGNFVIQPQFDDDYFFSEGLARVKINDKYSYIDQTGKMITPPQFDDAYYRFDEGLAAVKINDKWGYIDQTGKMITPLQFDSADYFSEGLARVKINDKWGYIDQTGKMITPLQFDNTYYFSQGLARVGINKKWGYIDKTGKIIVPIQFDSADYSFREGLASVEINGKYGYIDKTGKMIIPLQFDYAHYFHEGLAIVEMNDKYGYIDQTGKMIILPQFDQVRSFSEGLARVGINNKYGYIDKMGKIIAPLQFDNAYEFKDDGLAGVEINGKWGYIDKTGNFIIPLQFDDINNFSEGLARVKINDKWGYIDKTGKSIITPQLDDASGFYKGLAQVQINGKWGYIRNPLVK